MGNSRLKPVRDETKLKSNKGEIQINVYKHFKLASLPKHKKGTKEIKNVRTDRFAQTWLFFSCSVRTSVWMAHNLNHLLSQSPNTKQITCSVERVRRTMTMRLLVTRHMLHATFCSGSTAAVAASPQHAAFHSQQIYYGLFFSFFYFVSALCSCVNAVHSFSRHALVSVFGYYNDYTAQCGSFCSYFFHFFLFKECTMFPVLFSIRSDFRFCGGKRRQPNVPTRGRRVPKKKMKRMNGTCTHKEKETEQLPVCRNKMLSTFFSLAFVRERAKGGLLFNSAVHEYSEYNQCFDSASMQNSF